MIARKKLLILAYLFVLFHSIKDFFQDFLETDFLYFFDANENLMVLPQWGRVLLVLSNAAATVIGIGLVIVTPFILKKHLPRLEKIVIAAYFFFFAVLSVDLLLDPRLTNSKLFFDKSTRTPASQMKNTYQNILKQSLGK